MNNHSVEEMIDEVFNEVNHAEDHNNDKKPSVFIMVGNIGSGKSTLIRKLINMHDGVIINKDSLFESMCGSYGIYDSNKIDFYNDVEFELMRSSLKKGYNVFIDRLNINKEQRTKFINIAKEYTDKIIAYDFGHDNEEGLERRKKNNRGMPDSVWEKVFEITKKAYEPPTKEEGFSEIKTPPTKWYFVAFDFDKTIANTDENHNIKSLKQKTVDDLLKYYKNINNIIIIWTCRDGDMLNQALKFLNDNKIPYDYVNENPLCGFDCSNKIFAHKYYDDRAINIKDI